MKPIKLVEGEKPEVDKWLNSVFETKYRYREIAVAVKGLGGQYG